MKSIRVKITAAIVLCSLVTSLFISILSISNAGNLSNTLAEDELILTCTNSGNEINALISRIEQSVDTLTDVSMGQMIYSKFKSNSEYVDEYTKGIMKNFYKFAEHTDGAITAYIRYNPEFTEPTSGIFLTRNDLDSDFESVTPTDFSMYDKDDLAHVGWYYIPVANKAPIWMDPYLNENINVYMISYVVPLYQASTSVGIIGMDIDFRQVTDLVDEAVAFETGYSFIVNAEGKVLYHNEIPTGTDLAEYNDGELSTVKDFVLDGQNQGTILEYKYNGEKKSLTFVELDNGMKLVLTVPVKEIKANANTLSLQIVTFLVVSIILVVILGILIGGNMAKPIKKITQIIKKTSQLDFKEAEDMDNLAKKKDEIGVMAKAVREMRSVLRDVITEMEQVKDTLVVNMNQLEEVMKENNAISEDNSATTQELVAGMQETTANTTMIVGNIGAIQDNVVAIQKLSEKEQQESLDIMTRARMLKDNTVESNNVAMNIYATMKERTEEAIEKSQVVEKINELIEDIRNISSQTDLLALNASIEAARAGEAGKGFAIVATEIGALANQTVQSVDSITAFVGDINGAVNNMTECIQVIMKFLDETVVSDYASFNQVGEKYEKDAESFVEALQHISEEIFDLNHKITDIAGAIDNVNATITQSTYGVNTIAQKSTEAVEKTIEGYESLNESGNNLNVLKELIERFEV